MAHRTIRQTLKWEVGLAEAALTMLTNGHYQTGDGFNVMPGGV
jgi:hypothetical protein